MPESNENIDLITILRAFFVITIFGLLSPLLSSWPLPLTIAWLIDLLTHWQFIFAPTSIFIGLCLFWNSRSTLPITTSILMLIFCYTWPNSELTKTPDQNTETIKIISANLNLGQADLKKLKSWLDKTEADVIVLLEVTSKVAKQIDQWQEFSTRQFLPSTTPFGIGVLVRKNAKVEWVENNEIPYAKITLTAFGQEFRIYGIHPMPPLTPSDHLIRNKLISSLNEIAKNEPTIIAGDFNATPWSSALIVDGLFRASKLSPTWLGILPLDHVFASNHWLKVNAEVGPNLQSDHKPILTKLAIKTYD